MNRSQSKKTDDIFAQERAEIEAIYQLHTGIYLSEFDEDDDSEEDIDDIHLAAVHVNNR